METKTKNKKPAGTYVLREVSWSSDPRWVQLLTAFELRVRNEPDRLGRYHYAVLRQTVGDRGTLFANDAYYTPACGASLGSAWGHRVTTEQPYPDLVCQRCARLTKRKFHVVVEEVAPDEAEQGEEVQG